MGTQHRQKTVAHLSEKLPQLTVNETGGALWLNLWCGQREDGQRKLVARTQVDERIYNGAETDYHQESVGKLLIEFSLNHVRDAQGKHAHRPAEERPSVIDSEIALRKRVDAELDKAAELPPAIEADEWVEPEKPAKKAKDPRSKKGK